MSKQKPTKKAGIHLLKTAIRHKIGGKFQIKREFYWHLVASNGRIIARSSETYTRKRTAINSIRVAGDVFQLDYENMYYDHSGKEVEHKSIVSK
jgi:uncharacterized protein YegP (UPF0339 family)